MGLLILYLLLALVVSFLCSIMEATLLSTPFSFITMKEEEGSKAAKHLRNFTNSDLFGDYPQDFRRKSLATADYTADAGLQILGFPHFSFCSDGGVYHPLHFF